MWDTTLTLGSTTFVTEMAHFGKVQSTVRCNEVSIHDRTQHLPAAKGNLTVVSDVPVHVPEGTNNSDVEIGPDGYIPLAEDAVSFDIL